MKTIRAYAPATVANVCCGFDILGFAVDAPGDEVMVAMNDSHTIRMIAIHGDGGRLPLDADKNTAAVAVQSLVHALGESNGFDITLYKNLPLGSGMGSSAASAVAALVAANELLGNPKTRKELIPFAMEAERVACGTAHADNVAPSLLGGFVLIREYDPLDVIKFTAPEDLHCALVHPQLELKTEDSRRVLKPFIPLKDAVTQGGNIAGLMVGLLQSDYQLISRSLKDVIAEPIRSVFIPGYEELKQKIMDGGALGSGISGSGPTIFALCTDESTARKVGQTLSEHFSGYDLTSDVFVSRVNTVGARVTEGAG